jgi:hypothetical protein
VLSISAGDISGSQYLSCFDEHVSSISSNSSLSSPRKHIIPRVNVSHSVAQLPIDSPTIRLSVYFRQQAQIILKKTAEELYQYKVGGTRHTFTGHPHSNADLLPTTLTWCR